jgi:TetR/AcrR family transcriptional regulator, lmrAB and yxaGH operons repressor
MSRQQLIQNLMGAFRQYGYEGATLSRLSAATGLERASLYHHFPNGKEQMARVVLEFVKLGLKQSILAPLESPGDAEQRIRSMSMLVSDFYCGGQQGCLLAMFTSGALGDIFQSQIKDLFTIWIDALAAVAVETGLPVELSRRRAEDALIQIQGALVLTRGTQDQMPFKRVISRLPQIMLEQQAA